MSDIGPGTQYFHDQAALRGTDALIASLREPLATATSGRMTAQGPAVGEREAELARVLREVLKVIDSMAHCGPVEFEGVGVTEQPNGEECFGPFAEVYDAVVVWPDLRWAKDQIVKALGS